MKNAKRTEEKVNSIVDEILNEESAFDATRQSETCPEDCEAPSKETSRQCKCAVENSSRFSLRVMEAMRSLQRDQPITSSAEEIVDYIQTNYRSDGDLYAQVRTALRQVCSQGFALELMNNEYHLIGPVVSSAKQNGCSLDCRGHISTITDDISRREKRFPKRNGLSRQYPRSPRENSFRKTFISERPEDSITDPRFHSTSISMEQTVNDTRDDDWRDATRTREIRQRNEYEDPIPGPSGVKPTRVPSPIPMRNGKNARIDRQRIEERQRREDQRVQRATEDDEEITAEDLDCTCHPDVVQISQERRPRRRRRRDRIFIRDRVRRNGQRRENDEENEEDEMEERERDEEDEDEREEEEEEDENGDTEDTEDSVYRNLEAQSPRRRPKARERELKRWIRRCRQECERRMRAR